VRLPNLERAFQAAAQVLDVERADVPRLIEVQRLHYVLLLPAARHQGNRLYKSAADIAKCILVECARGEIVPRRPMRFAWLMFQSFLELNDITFERRPGDDERLKEFEHELLSKGDPGGRLRDFIADRLNSDAAPSALAQPVRVRRIHVSHPMTRLNRDRRRVVRRWAQTIGQAITDFAADSPHEPHAAEAVGPFVTSGVDLTAGSDQKFRQIARRLLKSDALIVIACEPSDGVGYELAVGLRTMVPTLYLYPETRTLSPVVRDALNAAGATHHKFRPDENAGEAIRHLVMDWLRTHYDAILDVRRKRDSNRSRLFQFSEALRVAHSQMTPSERRKRIVGSGLTELRANPLIEHDEEIQFASVPELLALSAAYDVPLNIDGLNVDHPSHRPPWLLETELDALERFGEKDGISQGVMLALAAAAQRELATPGLQRQAFHYEADWRALLKRGQL
jgi:hypothetical protein